MSDRDSTSDPDPLDRLAEEFVARHRRGECPSPTEYAGKYPEMAEQIHDLFPALVLMERLKPGEDDLARGAGVSVEAGVRPDRLGDYRILRQIGRGGMGVVYEAIQESLGRHVALKVLPSHGRSRPDHLERFRLEACSAARLHHTNIVPVFGVGEHEGVHYYAMQFIRGTGLDGVLRELGQLRGRGEPTRAARQTGPDVLTATVALAHGLLEGLAEVPDETTVVGARFPVGPAADGPTSPPSPNSGSGLLGAPEVRYHRAVARIGVQVAEALAYAHGQGVLHRDIKPSNLLLDAAGQVWVTDFGLAKLEGGPGPTEAGDIVGTLRFMAPERFDGHSDPRGDVYALGLTLYELMTLRPAFEADDRATLLHRVLHDTPSPPRRLDPTIPRDLETIVLKAMARDPSGRYPTAHALAEDLARFLADRPIRARRSSPVERSWRWCRRNPALATLSATVAVLLVALAVGSSVAAVRLAGLLAQAREAERGEREQLWGSYLSQAKAGRYSGRAGRRLDGLAVLARAAALDVFPARRLELRNEAIACLALVDLGPARSLAAKPPDYHWFALDPATGHYAWGDAEGVVRIHRLADSTRIALLPASGPRPHSIWLEYGPGGRWLWIGYLLGDRTHCTLWELRDGSPIREVPLNRPADAGLVFAPDGRSAVSIGLDRSVRVHHLDTGEVARLPALDCEPNGSMICPDGRSLAVLDPSRLRIRVVDLETGRTRASFGTPAPVNSFAWRGDGRLLAIGCDDQRIHVWDIATDRLQSVLEGHQNTGIRVEFSPGGDFLASGAWDNTLRLWDPVSGRPLVVASGLEPVNFGDGGRLLVYGKAQAREVVGGRECRTLRHGLVGNRTPRPSGWGPFCVDFHPGGRLLASADRDGVRLWDAASATEVAHLNVDSCESAVFDPRGEALATYSLTGLRSWPIRPDPATGGLRVGPPRRLDVPASESNNRAGWDRRGRFLVAAHRDGDRGVVLDMREPGRRTELGPHPQAQVVALSPDGRWAATSSDATKVWDVATGRSLLEVADAGWPAFSPDGRWLTLVQGQGYQLYHVGSWKPGPRVAVEGEARVSAFSADGTMMAARDQGRVVLAHPETGRELARLTVPDTDWITWLCFSPDGTQLAAASADHLVFLWDLRLIRAQLATLGLDWDAPEFPPAARSEADAKPLRVQVEEGSS